MDEQSEPLIQLTLVNHLVHQIILKLVKRLSIDHPQAKSNNGGKAFAEILKTNQKLCKSYKNDERFYDNDNVKSCIALDMLEISEIHSFLTKIKGYPTFTMRNDTCIEVTKPHYTQNNCCEACQHNCTKCKKDECKKKCCMTRECGNHPCNGCNKRKRDCKYLKLICCDTCKKCGNCWSREASENQCALFKLKESLSNSRQFRNMVSHETERSIKEFNDNSSNNTPFEGFENCQNWEELKDHLKNKICANILNYLVDEKNFRKANPLSREKCEKFLKKFDDIFVMTKGDLEKKYEIILDRVEKLEKTVNKKKLDEPVEEFQPRIFLENLSTTACIINLGDLLVNSLEKRNEKSQWEKLVGTPYTHNNINFLYVKSSFNAGHVKLKAETKDPDGCVDEIHIDEEFDLEYCLHINEYDKFHSMCHETGLTGSLSCAIKKILSKSVCRNDDFITIVNTCGLGKRNKTKNDWNKICEDYVNRNFDLKEPIQITRSSDCVNPVVSNIMNWLKKQREGGFVITSYDSWKHAKFLKMNVKQIAIELNISSNLKFDNRVLWYDSRLHVVYNIRIADAPTIGSINEAMFACCNDIKLLLAIEQEIFISSFVVIIGLTVIPDIVPLDTSNMICNDCKDNFLICKDNFLICNAKDTYDSSWHKKIKGLVHKIRFSNKREKSQKEMLLVQFFGRVVCFMSTEDVKLPTLSDNVSEQIKTVLLTREQREVIESRDTKIMVSGSFGSGKSIIGQLKLKKLMFNDNEETIIFYLCHDKDTMYNNEMERLAELFSKDKRNGVEIIASSVFELKEKYEILDSPGISDLLKYLYEKHANKRVHFIIEEFDGVCLTQKEATNLNNLVSDRTYEYIESSNVILISHTLQKDMVYETADKQIKHDKYNFESLTNFKTFELQATLRNTETVINISKAYSDKVQEEPNEYFHPNQVIKPSNKSDKSDLPFTSTDSKSTNISVSSAKTSSSGHLPDSGMIKDTLFTKMNPVKEPQTVNTKPREKSKMSLFTVEDTSKPLVTEFSKEVPSVKSSYKNTDERIVMGEETNKFIHGQTRTPRRDPKPSKVVDVKKESVIDDDDSDLDMYCSRMASLNNVPGPDKTKTSYMFSGKFSPGHNIVGEKPEFLWLQFSDEDLNNVNNQKYLSICLEYIWKEWLAEPIKMCCICLNGNTLLIVRKMMHLMDEQYARYTPSFNVSDRNVELRRKAFFAKEEMHLITDFKGFRGLEHDKVLLLLDKTDDAWKQYIVECVTRSTGYLYICLIHPLQIEKSIQSSIFTMLTADSSHFTQKHIKHCHDCKEKSECITEESCEENTFVFHRHSKDVQDRFDKIDDSIINDVTDHDKNIVEGKIQRDFVQPFLPKEDQTIISESYPLQEDNVSDFTFRQKYRLEILQQRFDVKLEFQGSKVQITGTTKNTQVVLLWFKEYERLKRENDTKQFVELKLHAEHMYGDYIEKSWSRHDICWSCIDFIPKDYIGAVIGKGGSNIKKLQLHFGVRLVVDCNIVLVYADHLNRHKIKTYFTCFKENFVASVETKSIHYNFLIGIKPDEEVELGNKDGCSFCSNKCFEIVRCDKSSIDISYANIYRLKDYFTKVIGLLKRAAKNSIAVDMQVHHGKIHYTEKDERRYQCHELVGMQDTRFSRDKWNHPLLIKSDICQKLIRYDFKIYSEDRNFFLRYKVFFKDSNGISTLKKNKALLGKFYNFEIGPGYFCIEEEMVAVIDVVDPNTNISSRFNFKKYQENTKNVEQITQAAESLRNVLEHLQNMDEREISEYLMKNLPEKYLLSFARRIDRTSYAISPKITLHSSEEVLLVDNCLPGTKIHNDVYLTHNTIDVRTADTSDILNGFLEILEAGSDIRASIVS